MRTIHTDFYKSDKNSRVPSSNGGREDRPVQVSGFEGISLKTFENDCLNIKYHTNIRYFKDTCGKTLCGAKWTKPYQVPVDITSCSATSQKEKCILLRYISKLAFTSSVIIIFQVHWSVLNIKVRATDYRAFSHCTNHTEQSLQACPPRPRTQMKPYCVHKFY